MYQHFENLEDKLEAKFYCRIQELEAKWYKWYEEKTKQILEKSAEIS